MVSSAKAFCREVATLGDLDQTIKTGEKVLALFYASWCPFCRAFLPVFEAEAQRGPRHFLMVRDDGETMSDHYNIDVVPTVLFFEAGRLAKVLAGRRGVGLIKSDFISFAQSCLPEYCSGD